MTDETSPPSPAPAAGERPYTPAETILETIFNGAKELVPALGLAATLPLLVLHALPESSEKLALAIAGGIAGFLTGRATAKAPK